MKKTFFLGMMLCLGMVAYGQRSMEWYSYWGSNLSGNQIEPQRMAVDNNGDIYVAALFGGTHVNVEAQTLLSQSATDKGDAVLVKMSPSKVVQWTYSVVASGKATITDVVIDGNGNIFVTGAFNNAIRVGNNYMFLDDSNWGAAAIYVMKISPTGQGLAAWQIPALGAKGGKLAIDSQNNVYVCGILDGDALFTPDGEAEGDFNNNAQMFVAKFDNNGNHLWHRFHTDDGAVSSYGAASLAVDANDNVYVGSSITGTTTLMGDPINASVSEVFLICYNASGVAQWYHTITGERGQTTADVAVSPIGEVAISVNHFSEELQIDGIGDRFSNGYAFGATYQHNAIFSFDFSGEFKWFYDWGYSNGDSGSDAICYALRCSDEGVWYVAGMMTGRYGAVRLPNPTIPNGKNSGVESVDNQWMQHNTNGGHDCYLLTLTRDGKLANVIRPGGTQYEDGMDVALSPDKKSIYFLLSINVRDNVPYTCPDNIFDSFTDLYAPANWPSRKTQYTLLNVFCPENDGTATKYTTAYKGAFNSSLLVKYSLPDVNPHNLPFFTVGQAYSQALNLVNPQGAATLFPLQKYGDVNFDGVSVSGTFPDETDRYVGVLLIDSIALPGAINYYAYDTAHHRSIRTNPRSVRYMPLTKSGSSTALSEVGALAAQVYPTLCKGDLYINCEEKNYTVNIYSIDGRMVFSHDNVAVVSVGGRLAKGMYQVEVVAGKGRHVTTIFVQ